MVRNFIAFVNCVAKIIGVGMGGGAEELKPPIFQKCILMFPNFSSLSVCTNND